MEHLKNENIVKSVLLYRNCNPVIPKASQINNNINNYWTNPYKKYINTNNKSPN